MKLLLKFPRLTILVALMLSSALCWYQVWQMRPPGILTLAMLDIGQGDAIFIETPSGNQILIDGGPGASVVKELQKHMSFFDNSIDMIVVTNPDKDHIGGFIEVLKRYEVGVIVEPGTVTDTATHKQLKKLAAAEIANAKTGEYAKRIIARRGMDFSLDRDVHLLILFPDKDASKMSTNDGSLVAKLVYGSTSAMLTGDAPEKTETYLLMLDATMRPATSTARLNSDILKVGHHGSKTSTSEAFVAAVSPQYALISAGKNNKYGHPAPAVLERLEKFGAQIFGTYEKGTIVFESDGHQWSH
jgi:competence protein ComEC